MREQQQRRVETVAGKTPTTDRGWRTRARLVAAAREVFEDIGFLDARITHIAARAGVAHGTFYTYFFTKEDIFREVARAVQQEMLQHPQTVSEPVEGGREANPVRAIERANRRYLEAYARNARIMAVLEQVATFSPELLEMRRTLRLDFVNRSMLAISRWQQAGMADAGLDARYAASALGSMVDRFAYVWLVLGDGAEFEFEFEKSVETLTRLWVQAIRLEPHPSRRR